MDELLCALEAEFVVRCAEFDLWLDELRDQIRLLD